MRSKPAAMAAIALSALLLAANPVFAEDSPRINPHDISAGKGGPRADGMEKRKAEMEKHRQEMNERGKERFAETDTNNDNFLTKEEMMAKQRARLDEMFSKTDTNHDGKLSPEELKKGREEMRAKYKERMKERHENKMGDKADEGPSE